jgi:hypothetical protein
MQAFDNEMREGEWNNLMLDLQGAAYATYSNIFAEQNRPVCVYAEH